MKQYRITAVDGLWIAEIYNSEHNTWRALTVPCRLKAALEAIQVNEQP